MRVSHPTDDGRCTCPKSLAGPEIHAQRFPVTAEKVVVSTSGGQHAALAQRRERVVLSRPRRQGHERSGRKHQRLSRRHSGRAVSDSHARHLVCVHRQDGGERRRATVPDQHRKRGGYHAGYGSCELVIRAASQRNLSVTLASGRRLGPYEILSALGAGGMGEVYRAIDSRLNRTVAIKMLSDAISGRRGSPRAIRTRSKGYFRAQSSQHLPAL